MKLFCLLIVLSLTVCNAKLLSKTTENIEILKGANLQSSLSERSQNENYINYRRTVRAVDAKTIEKNVTITNVKVMKDKVLVKKPIPKYHEVNSDEDYQAKYKWFQNQDSAEHEDEDFNINDYDFDVNHDEFASGRKPLEPRTKLAVNRPRAYKVRANIKVDKTKVSKPKLPRSLLQRKVVFPKITVPAKAPRNAVDKMREEDYDQEFSTTTRSVEETTHERDDEGSDEFEDSKEFVGTSSVRTVRSPWDMGIGHYVEKLGQRTVNMMSKILSHLPIFPQVPYEKKDDILSLDKPVKNPLRG
ncbi:unnamed protein product [Leptosia nina]|uniref:Uncharacterized protein n=1 Tax=Leptosia nina TaxID=320188 RepID=A0AAV1JAB0_9NEOP